MSIKWLIFRHCGNTFLNGVARFYGDQNCVAISKCMHIRVCTSRVGPAIRFTNYWIPDISWIREICLVYYFFHIIVNYSYSTMEMMNNWGTCGNNFEYHFDFKKRVHFSWFKIAKKWMIIHLYLFHYIYWDEYILLHQYCKSSINSFIFKYLTLSVHIALILLCETFLQNVFSNSQFHYNN